MQLSGQYEASAPRKRSPILTGSNKVAPEPGPPQPKVSKREDPGRRPTGSQSEGGNQDEDVVCTRIDDSDDEEESQATMGEEATYELNAGVDDTGDMAQLIVRKKESHGKRESMLEAW